MPGISLNLIISKHKLTTVLVLIGIVNNQYKTAKQY